MENFRHYYYIEEFTRIIKGHDLCPPAGRRLPANEI